METNTVTHAVTVATEGNKHRATCACGWTGSRRVFPHDARAEGKRHVADAKPRPTSAQLLSMVLSLGVTEREAREMWRESR